MSATCDRRCEKCGLYDCGVDVCRCSPDLSDDEWRELQAGALEWAEATLPMTVEALPIEDET